MATLLEVSSTGPQLRTERDATDLVGEAFGQGADTVVLPVERLDPAFFDLATGVAGAFMHKIVLYHLHLIVVGDISAYVAASPPLRDFVFETNAGSQVWFVPSRAELNSRLGQAQ